jgi:hypothetical protein
MQEMTGENRLAAIAQEEAIHAVKVLLAQPKPSAMGQQPFTSQLPALLAGDAVAENRGQGDDDDEVTQIEELLSRQEPATAKPWSAMFSTRFRPITPKPTMPISNICCACLFSIVFPSEQFADGF